MGQEDPATVFFLGMKGLVPYSGLAVVLTYSKSIANSLGSCAFLIIIPTLVAFFFGGMGFNAFTWAVVFASLCNSSLGICCVCPCFAICALLMYLAVGLNSPVQRYWELERIQPVHHVELCASSWHDFQGGIYFRDGTLHEHGQMPEAKSIEIARCYVEYHKFSPPTYYNCKFRARPVFQCDSHDSYSEMSDTCTQPRACAWAITASTSEWPLPPETPDCGKRNQGLCGFVTDMTKLIPQMAANSTSMDAFHDALQAVGANFSGLTSESPLFFLVNPAEETAHLGSWVGVYYLLLFLYVPFGSLCAFLTAVYLVGCRASVMAPGWSANHAD